MQEVELGAEEGGKQSGREPQQAGDPGPVPWAAGRGASARVGGGVPSRIPNTTRSPPDWATARERPHANSKIPLRRRET